MARLRDSGEPLYEIRYEDLCCEPQQQLQRFADAFDLAAPAGVTGGFNVAANEAGIHRNVDRQALPERIDAWKEEMPTWQGLVVERLAREPLRARGYQPFFTNRVSLPGRLSGIAYGYCYHLVATLYFQLRRRLGPARH